MDLFSFYNVFSNEEEDWVWCSEFIWLTVGVRKSFPHVLFTALIRTCSNLITLIYHVKMSWFGMK